MSTGAPSSAAGNAAVGNDKGLLRKAWIANYLLSERRFDVRRRALQMEGTLASPDSRTAALSAARWRQFFNNARLVANPNPGEVYSLFEPDVLVGLDDLEVLRAVSLTLCFWKEGTAGRPAPANIAVDGKLPFLEKYPDLQDMYRRLVAARDAHAPLEITADTLNSGQSAYTRNLFEAVMEAVRAYNKVQSDIQSEEGKRAKAAGLVAPTMLSSGGAAVAAALAAERKVRYAARNKILAQIFEEKKQATGPLTVQLCDLAEQCLFVLMGMVRVVDYSDLEILDKFRAQYGGQSASATAEELLALSRVHARYCRRLLSICYKFNRPDPADRFLSRDLAFIRMVFPDELPSGLDQSDPAALEPYTVTAMQVPYDAAVFASRHQDKLFTFVYPPGDKKEAFMTPASSFLAQRDINVRARDSWRTMASRDAVLQQAVEEALTGRSGAVADVQARDAQSCSDARKAALMLMDVRGAALDAYEELLGKDGTPCPPKNSPCIAKRVEVALKQPNYADALATSLLRFNDVGGLPGCQPRGKVAQALCEARVLRALDTDVDAGVAKMTGGDQNDRGDQKAFARLVCSPGGAYFSEFGTVPAVASAVGAQEDAKALSKIVEKFTDKNQSRCGPSLTPQKCKRADMATCLLAALVDEQAAAKSFLGEVGERFTLQRTACQTVREDLNKMRRRPDWAAMLRSGEPCKAVQELLEQARESTPAVKSVLKNIYADACNSSPGIASSVGAEKSVEAFDAFCGAVAKRIAKSMTDHHDGMPRALVLPTSDSASFRDLERAIELVAIPELAVRRWGSRHAPGMAARPTLAFATLDLSSFDMFLLKETPVTRDSVMEGEYSSRALSWAIRGPSGGADASESPAALLKDTDQDALLPSAYGAMCVFILFRVADVRLAATTVGTALGTALDPLYQSLVFNMLQVPLRACQAFSNDLEKAQPPGRPPNPKFKAVRRMDYARNSPVVDAYVVRCVRRSVAATLNRLGGRETSLGAKWLNQFRILLSLMPLLAADGIRESAGQVLVNTTQCPFVVNLLEPVIDSKASGGHAWTRPEVPNAERIYREIGECFRATDANWLMFSDQAGGNAPTLPPVATGSFLQELIDYLLRQERTPKGDGDDAKNFWTLWMLAIMSFYKPNLLTSQVNEDVVRYFDGENRSWTSSTLHVFYRVLSMSGNEGTDLGMRVLESLQNAVVKDGKEVEKLIEKIEYCTTVMDGGQREGNDDGGVSFLFYDYLGLTNETGGAAIRQNQTRDTNAMVSITNKGFARVWKDYKAEEAKNNTPARYAKDTTREGKFHETINEENAPSFMRRIVTGAYSAGKVAGGVATAAATQAAAYIFNIPSLAQTSTVAAAPTAAVTAAAAAPAAAATGGGTRTSGVEDVVPNIWSMNFNEEPLKTIWNSEDRIIAFVLDRLERKHMLSRVCTKPFEQWKKSSKWTVGGYEFQQLFVIVTYLYPSAFGENSLLTKKFTDIARSANTKNTQSGARGVSSGVRGGKATPFPNSDAILNNIANVLVWEDLSPFTVFKEELKTATTMSKFEELAPNIMTYSRIMTAIGILYQMVFEKAPKMDPGESLFLASIICAGLQSGRTDGMDDVVYRAEAETVKNFVMHPLFDPQQLIFKLTPYALISNLVAIKTGTVQEEEDRRQTMNFMAGPSLTKLQALLYEQKGAVAG